MRRSPFAMSNKIGSLERQLMDAFDEEEGINRQENQTENAFTGRRKTKFLILAVGERFVKIVGKWQELVEKLIDEKCFYYKSFPLLSLCSYTSGRASKKWYKGFF